MTNSGLIVDQNIVDAAKDDRFLFGWLPAYPMFMFAAIIAVIIASIIRFRMKKIPTRELRIAIYIAVPLGVIGASIFGKLGTNVATDFHFWELVYFWNPGMNLYGALLVGGGSSFIYLWKASRIKRISIWVYADAIVPNIALGQAIGRWGNLFNHEILGREVHNWSEISWLPHWITDKLFYLVDPSNGHTIDNPVYREPLFLYESIGDLIIWVLLIFVITNLGRWFSTKPWKKDSKNFPCKYNKANAWAVESTVKNYGTQAPIKYKKNKDGKIRMSLWQVWNKAYYLFEPSIEDTRNAQKLIDDQKLRTTQFHKKFINTKEKENNEIEKLKLQLNKGKIDTITYRVKVKEIKKSFHDEIVDYKKQSNRLFAFFRKDSKELTKVNNPNGYFIMYSGTLSSAYIFLYTLLRMVLESFRNVEELSIKWYWGLDYAVFALILIAAILMFISAQFIAPKKWREEGWLYEKSY